MKSSKTWHVVRPELFNAGSIELHTSRRTLIKNVRAFGGTCEDTYLKDCAGACRYDDMDSNSRLYVYVGDGQLTTLVHECFHAAVRYLAWVGVPLEHNKSNETYAYFLEYLVREFSHLVMGKK